MAEEILHKRGETLVRRQCLAPGESTPWHRDPFHRVTVVLRGDALAIEYLNGSPGEQFPVGPGQADWEEPTERVHRGVNVGLEPYEEITIFFLDHPDAEPQPPVNEADVTEDRGALESLPIACTLTPAELAAMRDGLLPGFLAKVSEKEAISGGYRLRFDPEPGLLKEAARVIEAEQRCCRFLRFGLIVEPGDGPIWLELTGPEGTREFLSTLLDAPPGS